MKKTPRHFLVKHGGEGINTRGGNWFATKEEAIVEARRLSQIGWHATILQSSLAGKDDGKMQPIDFVDCISV